MKINIEKLRKQESIIQKWIDNNGVGSVVAATGFGKTFIAILLIQRLNKKSPDATTIVVVPTKYLKGQWEAHIKEFDLKNVTVMVINTVIMSTFECDFLVLDEAHRYAADKFQLVFNVVRYSYILGLTATMERADGRHTIVLGYCPVIAEVDIQESRRKGYVSEFAVFNLGIEFPGYLLGKYEALNNKFNFFFATFDHDFHLAMACIKDQLKISRVARAKKLTPKKVQAHAVQFVRTMQKRKKMLYESPEKIPVIEDIVNKFDKEYTIIFTETIAHAEQIREALGDIAVSYHSDLTAKQLKENIRLFKDRRTKVRVLVTAKALDEGFNIEGIGLAIIASGNSTVRQTVQRTGRAIRYVEGKVAIIINLFMNGTKEESWIRQRQKGMPNVLWVTKLEDIDYESEKTLAVVD